MNQNLSIKETVASDKQGKSLLSHHCRLPSNWGGGEGKGVKKGAAKCGEQDMIPAIAPL